MSAVYALGAGVVAWTELPGTQPRDSLLPSILLICLAVLFAWSCGVAHFQYHPGDVAERLDDWIAGLAYQHSVLFGITPSVVFTGASFVSFTGEKRQAYVFAGAVSLVVSLLVVLYAGKYHAVYAAAHPSFRPYSFYQQ